MKIEKTDKYIKVIAEDGGYLTSYKDGDNIWTYTSSRIIYAPLNADLSDLRDITAEENNNYEKLRLEAENGE
jgi:hypothetical protein